MCVFVSSILATVPLVKARRVLHFGVYLEDYTCSVYFSVQLEPTEVAKEVHTGALFFFYILCAQPSSCGACLHFYREKGSAVPFPRRP